MWITCSGEVERGTRKRTPSVACYISLGDNVGLRWFDPGLFLFFLRFFSGNDFIWKMAISFTSIHETSYFSYTSLFCVMVLLAECADGRYSMLQAR